jgi:hypothetical protein
VKFTITVTDFRPLRRNTLRGLAVVHVDELKLSLHDVAIHQHENGSRWVGLPGKAVIDRDGNVRRKADGRVEYVSSFSFDTRAVSDAFSAAVIAALLERDARAFEREGV